MVSEQLAGHAIHAIVGLDIFQGPCLGSYFTASQLSVPYQFHASGVVSMSSCGVYIVYTCIG